MRAASRILVVQRDAAFAARLSASLRERGLRAHVASSAAAALAEETPDLLVCDLRLPECGAWELLAELDARGTKCASVLTAESATVADCRLAMRAGARELLVQPFSFEELLEAVLRLAPKPALPSPARSQRLFIAERSSIEANTRALRELVSFLVAHGFACATRARVATATAEVLENVLLHAYPDSDGPFQLEVIPTPGKVRVEVSDEGIGFDALRLAIAGAGPSVSGLARARSLSENLSIGGRPEGGARVVLEFASTSCVFGEERGVDLSDLDHLDPATSRRVLTALRDRAMDTTFHLSPALAVCVGRLLSATCLQDGSAAGRRS